MTRVSAAGSSPDPNGAGLAAAAAGSPTAPADEIEEKDSFDVVLESVGEKKIHVIKEVRTLVSLGLGEAKALVGNAPGVVLNGANKETAEKAGAKVRLSPAP